MIHLQNIEKVYRTDTVETLALHNITLQVEKGEFLSIMGPSGCGKSTMLNLMGLLDAPTKGEVKIAGTKLENLPDTKLAEFRNR
ncbi:MAG TPA: ATP-binding cassette domain-containing protein, partial [Chitinophaga sp.]